MRKESSQAIFHRKQQKLRADRKTLEEAKSLAETLRILNGEQSK